MKNVSNVAAALKKIRESAGLSVRSMADRLDMPSNSYVHYESRYKKPYLPADFVEQVASVVVPLGVDRGSVMALAGLDQGQLPMLPVENGHPTPSGSALVPVFDISASAGPGSHVDEYEAVSHSLAFPPDYLSRLTRAAPQNLAIISVKGDSMTPTLKDDDIVMLDMSKTNLSFDGLFVLRFGDALHVKRVARSGKPDHITIVSDNERVPAQDYPAREVQVIGKVIWAGGKV